MIQATPLPTSPQGLAIFGGAPLFPEPLHVGRPNLGDRARFLERVNDIFDRRWLSNSGRYVREFEERIASYLGVEHCVAMCNGTVALEIAVRALGMKGEVIVPSFTFIATPHCLQWQEITPVFCDIDPVTCTIDPAAVVSLITPRTTGILPVHLWGRPCQIECLEHIARRHNLRLLFDASHAFGCTHGGTLIGSFGDAEVFSFHATKFLNSFEGGAVVTNNTELARQMRLMKNFGFQGLDNVGYLGVNGKMNEAAAAMGLTNLESIDTFIEWNRNNYHVYRDHLRECQGLRLLSFGESEKNNYQYIAIDVDERIAGLSRDQLLAVLQAENVLARRYFYPGCHRMEPYRSLFPNAHLWLPQTERMTARSLCLPTGTAVSQQEVAAICDLILLALHDPDHIRSVLPPQTPSRA